MVGTDRGKVCLFCHCCVPQKLCSILSRLKTRAFCQVASSRATRSRRCRASGSGRSTTRTSVPYTRCNATLASQRSTYVLHISRLFLRLEHSLSIIEFRVFIQGDHGGQRLHLVYFILEVFPSCLTALPFLPNYHYSPSKIGQTVEQPKQSQQNLVRDHHGHPVVRLGKLQFTVTIAEFSHRGRLVRAHLVRGHQGVFHHVDQLVHGEPDGRLLEPHAALRLLHHEEGRLPRLLGHPLPAEGAATQRQGRRQNTCTWVVTCKLVRATTHHAPVSHVSLSLVYE